MYAQLTETPGLCNTPFVPRLGVGRPEPATTYTVCSFFVGCSITPLDPASATYSLLTADAVEKVAEPERGNGIVQRNLLGRFPLPLMYAQLTQTFAD